MIPIRVIIEKAGRTLAEANVRELTELSDGGYEIVVEDLHPGTNVPDVKGWEAFNVIVDDENSVTIYGPCEWKAIRETGTLGEMVPHTITVIARSKLKMTLMEV